MMIYIKLDDSKRKNKRFVMKFYNNDKLLKKIHFGQKNPVKGTYIDHKDKTLRNNYIKRHAGLGTENWENPYTAGTLSRFILWGNYSELPKALKAYAHRFGFQIMVQ